MSELGNIDKAPVINPRKKCIVLFNKRSIHGLDSDSTMVLDQHKVVSNVLAIAIAIDVVPGVVQAGCALLLTTVDGTFAPRTPPLCHSPL